MGFIKKKQTFAYVEKVNKLQHPFMIKAFNTLGIEGTYLNIIKAIYDRRSANIILNREKLKAFPLRLGKRQRCHSHHSYSIQYWKSSLEKLCTQRNTRHPNRKEVVKFLLFADDIILYIENPKESTKKVLELISDFCKAAAYKINIQKSVAFLYTNKETSEKINKMISFTRASKSIKYLGIHLTKEVKYLQNKNMRLFGKKLNTQKNGKIPWLMD